MESRKNSGSYYTPAYLARFISKRVISHFEGRARISVLEPSVGDGAFVDQLGDSNGISVYLTALDINREELTKAEAKWEGKPSRFIGSDFLMFSENKRFSAVVGNPPYVKKNRLSGEQIRLSKEIHLNEGLTEASVKNIWATFLIKASTLIVNDGVLAFVLPSELLQVKFAEEIREYLKREFQRIEIFTFDDLMFECKGQDTVVLFAYKKSKEKGEFFANIKSRESLEDEDFDLKKNDSLLETKVKWIHHFLDSEELAFLNRLKKSIGIVDDYVISKPGIVTAANKFFIIDKETEEQYDLSEHTKPIIQKGLFVNGSVVFSHSDYKELEDSSKPSRLLQLKDEDKHSSKLTEYLAIGVKEEIPERYKCRIRNNWYVIPNISVRPEAFFFKRSHLYPKLLKNNSDAYVTDSAYKIEMKAGFDLDSFIYSFYNTLTLLFSELEGRYYGGGVLELTPSEFKKLPIPYRVIDGAKFEDFSKRFEEKGSIEEIIEQNDAHILGIGQDDVDKLRLIRKKLVKKRLRN